MVKPSKQPAEPRSPETALKLATERDGFRAKSPYGRACPLCIAWDRAMDRPSSSDARRRRESPCCFDDELPTSCALLLVVLCGAGDHLG